ncbi:MAG TPA: AAA family ATPase [Defluviitoga tunisiensis]|nr:AAA family ATPase [Defluviitoga tunisiensis]
MKPIKLKFQAFGPFVEEQGIDFSEIANDGLFLITGPTGAGKTSIFDAISFALYGKGSMEERERTNIRSDFADENIETYVQFEFYLKDKRIEIYRTPSYEKVGKDGKKNIKNPYARMIMFQDDKLIIEECGSDKVTKKVEELLNLNYQQFRQIVMLPQGEFRRFILANSNEREEIFKRIFDISLYEKFEEKIDAMYKEIKRKLEDNKKEVEIIAKGILIDTEEFQEFVNNSDLSPKKIIQHINQEVEQIHKSLETINIQKNENQSILKNLEEKLQKIKSNNELIDKREAIKKELQELSKQKETMVQKEELLRKLDKVEKIIPYEENWINLSKDLKEKKILLEKLNIELLEREEKQGTIDETFNKLEEDYQKISLRNKEIEELNEKLESLKNYEQLDQEFQKLSKQLGEKNKELSKIESEISQNKKVFEENEHYITANEDINIEILERNLKDIVKYENSCNDLINEYLNFTDIVKRYREIQKEKNDIEQLINRLRDELDRKTHEIILTQAYRLAETLEEGKPCPVCGSIIHPDPAKSEGQIVTEKEIEDLNKKIERAEEKRNEIVNKYETIKGENDGTESRVMTNYKRICEELAIEQKEPTEMKSHIEKIIKTLQEKLKVQQKEYDEKKDIVNKIKSLKEENKKIKLSLDILQKKKEVLQQEIDELKSKILQINMKKKTVAEHLEGKTLKDINREIEEINQFITNTSSKYEEIRKAKEANLQEIHSLKGKIATITGDINQLSSKVKESEEKLNKMIRDMELVNYENYKSLKDKLYLKDQLEEEIEIYNLELQKKKNLLEEYERSVKNIGKIDELPLVEEINEMKEKNEILIRNETSLENKKVSLKTTKLEMEKLQKEAQQIEKDYNMIVNLRNVSKGDNDSKVSLTKYVLTYYFEEIIMHANERLMKLTNNRYVMRRSTEVLDARRKEGLEIMVLDHNTGKERHIKSLSGGESFEAALALALGLADVVQSHSGGISLDTIFIDEGFGSLDPNSLDRAIEVLLELNDSGRAVGIISHVEELKERIFDKIEVIPTAEGSFIKY